MPRSKLAAFKQQLRAAEDDVQLKTKQLAELKEQVAQARSQIEKLEGEVNTNAALEDDVQTLLRHQQETAAAFKDYENRVLALELQSLVDRWHTMDIEELSQQNHELREECLRLQQENMQLGRAVAEHSMSARRDLAKIEQALEITVKEKMREMHDRLRQELYDEMDEKTKKMVAEHGYLQDYVRDQAAQAATLDRHYRSMQAERARFKMDADVAGSLTEQQALQAVGLRRQLKQALQVVEALQRRLAESEARAQAAWDEAVRASSKAAVAAAAAARAGLHIGSGGALEVDVDSAYGMAGEGAEIAALESQLRHSKQRFERMRLQRDRWRERCTLYERACAQLQAALQTLQDQSRLVIPGRIKQDLDSIWCAAKAADATESSSGGVGAGGGGVWGSRPSTPPMSSDVGEIWGDRQGFLGASGDGWPVGGGAAAAGAVRLRATSAIGPGSGAGGSPIRSASELRHKASSLPVRPHTAAPAVGAAAAKREAESIRASVHHIPPKAATPTVTLTTPTAAAAAAVSLSHGGSGNEAALVTASMTTTSGSREGHPAAATTWSEEDEAGAAVVARTRGSVSPPGHVSLSRLYSSEPEAFKVVPKVQYDKPGWPVLTEMRPISPNRAQGAGGATDGQVVRPSTAHLPLSPSASTTSPLVAMASPQGSLRRTPGSMRPHSAIPMAPSPSPSPRWTPGRSLTGLTSSPSAPPVPPATADAVSSPGSFPTSENAQPMRPTTESDTGGRTTSERTAGSRSTSPLYLRGGAVHQAVESNWQSWQAQRERSKSPEHTAIARETATSAAITLAAATVACHRQYGNSNGQFGGGGIGQPITSLATTARTTGTPSSRLSLTTSMSPTEIALSSGALFAAVHNNTGETGTAAAGAAIVAQLPSRPVLTSLHNIGIGGGSNGGGGTVQSAVNSITAPGELPASGTSTSTAPSTASSTAVAALTVGGRMLMNGPMGPMLMANPSAMLTALRRPQSSFQRLHNPDVLFTGARVTSARGGGGAQRGSGGTGGGNGVFVPRPSSTGSNGNVL